MYKNIEKRKAYHREWKRKWMIKNKDKYRKYMKEWRANNKEKIKKYTADSYNTKVNTERTKKYNRKRRQELINILGGKCVRCGFSDWRALQVDHVNGGGCRENRERPGIKTHRYIKEIKNGRKDLQLLCANCNWIKRYEMHETV